MANQNTAIKAPIRHPLKTLLLAWLSMGTLTLFLEAIFLSTRLNKIWLDNFEVIRFIMSHFERFRVYLIEFKAPLEHRFFVIQSVPEFFNMLNTLLPLYLLALIPILTPLALVAFIEWKRNPEAELWQSRFPMMAFAIPCILPMNGFIRRAFSLDFDDMEIGISIIIVATFIALGHRLLNATLRQKLTKGATYLALSLLFLPQIIMAMVPTRSWVSGRSADAPNILLISIDSLRADHLGSYGYFRDTSPVIDQLAAEGVRFDQVVSSTSWTLPSHHTMLTGLTPEQHGVTSQKKSLNPRVVTLAEALKSNGYATSGIVAGFFLSRSYGFMEGFDHYDDYSVLKRHGAGAFKTVTSPQLVDLATDWLGDWHRWNTNQPFFMFLHLWDVHYDYIPPPPYDTLFDPDYTGTFDGRNFDKDKRVNPEMDRRDLEHIISLYDGEIRHTDAHIGRLIDFLKSQRLLDNTIVAIVADHGEEFFEHGRKGHMKNLHDESIMIPWVMRFPGKIPANSIVESQVRLMDVSPTLLSLAGAEIPPGFAKFNGEITSWDVSGLISEELGPKPPALPGISSLYDSTQSLRTLERKFIWKRPKKLFFDLQNDPQEQEDLSKLKAAEMAEYQERLTPWIKAVPNHKSRHAKVSDSVHEQLKALGYVE